MSTETQATWVKVANVDEIEEGEALALTIGERSIALYYVEDEGYFATDNICTHAFAHLTEGFLEGYVVECPLHAGCFDVRTGQGMGPPIVENLQTYDVRVQQNEIEICIPTE